MMFAHVECMKRTTGTWRLASCALQLCGALTIACFSGCGGDRGPERVIVSGTVTYNGKPIPKGMIRFVPVATSPVPATGASIVDGKYRADDHGGVSLGTHKIQIEAFRKVAVHLNPGEQMPATINPLFNRDGGGQQYLPKRFNAGSQLEIVLQPGSREITKNFDLTD